MMLASVIILTLFATLLLVCMIVMIFTPTTPKGMNLIRGLLDSLVVIVLGISLVFAVAVLLSFIICITD